MKAKIGHYEIVQELGRGGMGVVYKGFESALNRFVAIKTLSESLAHDPSIVERFMREARSMASLNDPHIIQIYFVGEDQGQPYFAMEFVEGESLSQKLKREGRLPAAVACQILLQTAQGLTTAHDRGVIHRDIKPANLMITQRGLVKVADFGIALATRDFSKKLTSTGEFVGTPGYLSPEVCMAKHIDQRSDIFSLGIVLFEMLTGRIPFNDASPLGLMLEVVQAAVPDVRTLNSEVDANVHAILSRMVAKEPEDRYQSCHELIEDLVAIGTSTVSGLNPKPLSAQVIIPPAVTGAASGRGSAVSGISAAAGMPPAPAHPVSAVPRATPAVPAQQVPAQAAYQTVVSSPHHAHPAPRKGSAMPWLAAAAVLLGGAGYAGWHFRAELGLVEKSNLATTTVPDTATDTTAPPVAQQGTSPAVDPNSAPAGGNAPGTTLVAADPAASPLTADPGADSDPGQGSSWFSTDSPATSNQPAGSTPQMGTAAVATAEAPDTLAELKAAQAELTKAREALEQSRTELAQVPSTPASPQLQGPAPRAGLGNGSNLERLSDRVNARAGAPVFAQAGSPPVAKAVAPSGRVLVVAFGHPGAAAAAQQVLADGLSGAGYTIIEPDMIGGLRSLVGGDRDPDFQGLARLAAGSGVDVIVTARVRVTGTQELTYYGQSSTMFTSLVGVRAYAVQSRSSLGSWQESLNFTSLNVLDNTREAVEPSLDELARKLRPYRGRG